MSESTQSTASRLNYAAAAGRTLLVAVALIAFTFVPGIVKTGRLPHVRVPAGALHAPDLALIAQAPLAIQVHLATLALAALMAVILFSGIKGSRLHRTLGWIFSVAMLTTGLVTLAIPPPAAAPHLFGFGPLHIFSLTALIGVPYALWSARNHKAIAHGRTMLGLSMGGLIIAGLGAFTPGRLMWQVLFG